MKAILCVQYEKGLFKHVSLANLFKEKEVSTALTYLFMDF
jgi:hypothetical protein